MPRPLHSDVVITLRAAGCVFAEDEADLLFADAPSEDVLADRVRRRVGGEPLEYVLGRVEFCGHRIAVVPGVFVPRQRTAALAREAVARASRGAVVVDLCCGSGALGVVLADAVDGIGVYAADIDPVAVACARDNLAPYGGSVFCGDLFEALPTSLRGRVDVLVCNAPYVPTAAIVTLPPEARDHEPRVALDGGTDGLDVLRRVVGTASDWLAPGGSVLVETGIGQVGSLVRSVTAAGLTPHTVTDDDTGATVVIGTRRGTRWTPRP